MIWENLRSDQILFLSVKMGIFYPIVAVGYFFDFLWLQGFTSLPNKTLRNYCKHAKIPNVVNMRPVKGYEPSY